MPRRPCTRPASARCSNFAASFAKKTQILLEESRFPARADQPAVAADRRRLDPRWSVRSSPACAPTPRVREITIQFVNRVPDDLDQIDMDHQLVEMLVFNLIENAVKYSHRGREVFVEVSLRGREWVLIVTDYGTYIRPEDCLVIFKPFIRRPTGSAATSRPGTGLGLAVAKAVVEVHGGRVDVKSDLISPVPEPFAMTEFVVRMPRKVHREER